VDYYVLQTLYYLRSGAAEQPASLIQSQPRWQGSQPTVGYGLGGFAVRLSDLWIYEDEIKSVQGPDAGKGGSLSGLPSPQKHPSYEGNTGSRDNNEYL